MKYLYNNELSYYKSVCYMVTLQEFLKSKGIKYLFFQPWCDILGSEEILNETREKNMKWPLKGGNEYQKECYQEDLTIGNIIKKIDKKYVIGPRVFNYSNEYNLSTINSRSGKNVLGDECNGHPNKDEHKIIAKFIKEKLVDVYS